MRRSSKRGLGLVGKSSRTRRHDEDIDYREQYDDEYDDYPEDDYDDDYSDVEDDDYYEDDREYDESDDAYGRDEDYRSDDRRNARIRDDQEYERETDGIDDDEYDRDYDDDRDYYEDDYEDDDSYEDEDGELYEGDEDYRNVEDIDARRNYEHDDYDEDDEDYDDVYDDYVADSRRSRYREEDRRDNRRDRDYKDRRAARDYDDRRSGRGRAHDDWHDRRDRQKDDSGSGVLSIITESTAIERIAAFIFVLLIAGAVATGVFYKKAMDKNHEISSFASVGENYGETEIVGESGLIAVADAQRAKLEAAQLISADEEAEEEENSEKEAESATINVSMSVATIKSDIKIKFTNSKTGKLIASTPFTVTVKNPDGSSITYDDHDQDGIIYKKDLTAGKYTVTPNALSGDYAKYKVDTSSKSVTVKNTVEMKAVDVTGEVKKESEVNVAKEDTAVADKVESALTDTVEWVESTKTAVGDGTDGGDGSYTYEAVDKSNIVDPSSSAMNGVGRFMFLAFAATSEENSDNDEEDKEFKVKSYDVTLKIGETSKIEITDGPS
ncbi:MAG: hypothetical protein J6H31_14470, partial [Butyrivibrio sp.]|nr:hypothetical protein [Butyrivibrio sp.]